MLSYGFKLIKSYIVLEGAKYIGKQFVTKGLPKIMLFMRNNKYVKLNI